MSELAYAEIPTALTDKIRKGVGIIDLLQESTVTELQEYLANGSLYLDVDVNEEASGNESADSGGVAIAEKELIIATTEGSFSFQDFYTNTTSMIVDSYFKRRFPRFQKYPDWVFFAKRSLWGCFSVEDGQCLNSH